MAAVDINRATTGVSLPASVSGEIWGSVVEQSAVMQAARQINLPGSGASIDVVTADGELVRADEQSNSDLFWAARGAGPGFCGAITRFHLRTRPVPKGLAATTHI